MSFNITISLDYFTVLGMGEKKRTFGVKVMVVVGSMNKKCKLSKHINLLCQVQYLIVPDEETQCVIRACIFNLLSQPMPSINVTISKKSAANN